MIQAPVRSSNARKYANPNPLHQLFLRRFLDKVVEEVGWTLARSSRPSLLDVGCGEGYVLGRLAGAFPQLALRGIDGDHQALAVARASRPGISFWQGDVGQLPFRDDSFDVLICLEVLEHVQEPGQVLEELARVSRGYVLMSVPRQPHFALANFLRGRNWSRLGEDEDHLHHWTASRFLALVKGRMQVIRLSYPFPWMLLLAKA